MKKHLLAVSALVAVSFFCTSLAAQVSIEQNVISVAGATAELNNGGTIAWTVGESFVSTHKIQDRILTEGFHQPYLVACDLNYDSKVTCVGTDEFIVELTVENDNVYQLLVDGETHEFTKELVVGPFSNNIVVEASLRSNKSDVCFESIKFENVDCKQENAQIVGFDANTVANGNQLNWSLVKANESDKVTLLTSNDGVNFEAIHNADVTENALLHENTTAGFTFYRLQVTNNDGQTVDNQTIQVVRIDQVAEANIATEVFPNPVVDYLNVSFDNYNEKEVVLSVYSIAGKLLKTQLVQVENKTVRMDMNEFGVAFYLLSIATPNGVLLDTHKIQKLD